MATNFDKSHELKTLTSNNLHQEEFLKTICIGVIRRATKLCFMHYSQIVILFSTGLSVFSAYFFSNTRFSSFCVVFVCVCVSVCVCLHLLFLNFSFSFLFWKKFHFKRLNNICIIREYDLVHFHFVLNIYKRSVKT